MAEMFTIHIDVTSTLAASIDKKAEAIVTAVRQSMVRELGTLLAYIKDEKLSGQVLHQRTGNLKGSGFIESPGFGEGGTFTGYVGFGREIDYAAVLNYGGKGYYDIYPVNAKALRFFARGGMEVFARHVHHPPLPARNYLESSAKELQPEITANMQAAVTEAAADA